jgi:hypothetical protein
MQLLCQRHNRPRVPYGFTPTFGLILNNDSKLTAELVPRPFTERLTSSKP